MGVGASYRHPYVTTMRRYYIYKDDITTARGRVLSGSSHQTLQTALLGVRGQAYEHDLIYCESCKTTGKIICVGPRIPFKGPDNRQLALSDDLCACKCHPPPHLIARQDRAWMEVDAGVMQEAITAYTATTTTVPSVATKVIVDKIKKFYLQFILRDGEGNALADTNYTIQYASGKTVQGITDSDGRIERRETVTDERITVCVGHLNQRGTNHER